MNHYSIDPSLLSLEEFKELSANRRMLPGRVMLHEQMDERFGLLKRSGMETLGDVLRILGSKLKIHSFAIQTGLTEDYLVVLKREAGSYIAKPIALSSFPGIPFEYVELLKSRGINNTKHLFEQVQSEKEQEELSESTGIPAYRLKELSSLCDLSRITGVGGIFARVLYEAGIHSTEEFANTDTASLLNACQLVIEKHAYAVGKLGKEDMNYGIHYARLVVSCDHLRDNL
jgi:hypothetical protein